MKRSKQRATFLSVIILTLSTLFFSASAAQSAVGIVIDGKIVSFTQESGTPFVDASNRTQVPLRATMEAYGCTVDWDQASQTAIVSRGGTSVCVPIGQPYILVNGVHRANDTAALIQNNRTYLPIRAVLEAFGGYVSWDATQNRVLVDTSSPLLKIYFLDVGQGDAIFIDSGTTEVLIDGGDKGAGKTVVSAIRPYVDGNLEYIIATHSDSDHIGGLDDVLYAYNVSEVIDSGYAATSATYQAYRSAVQQEPGCVMSLDENRILDLGSGATLRIIETGDNAQTPNDSSVVAELSYSETSVLFTGDISESAEKQSLSLFSDIDVLKVAHHGSATSTSADFLAVVRPEHAVISYAPGNCYHHPAASTLQRLLNCGSKIYGTGKSGTIVLSTNGKFYSFQQSTELTLANAGINSPTIPSAPPSTTASKPNDHSSTVSKSEASCVGNSNSKKYHTMTCRYAASIAESNLIYFRSPNEAQAAGYVPCQVCH